MKGFTDSIKRKVGCGERSMLILPFNVVMAAKIRGNVDPEQLKSAIGKLRVRHALLAVRVETDEHDIAWFVGTGVPDPDLEVIDRLNENQWVKRVEAEFNNPFSLETGPLVRFILWKFSKDGTKALVEQCRANNVTINTALWTAFLAAQHEVQSPLSMKRWSVW